jgi:hypothetical protein
MFGGPTVHLDILRFNVAVDDPGEMRSFDAAQDLIEISQALNRIT